MTEPQHGGFSVWQNGVKVAGGGGPYDWIKAEAAHYAAVYAQDGPVKVRVYKYPRKKPNPQAMKEPEIRS